MSIERFAVSELSTLKWSFEEDVENLKKRGVDAIGVWRHKLSEFGQEKGAELLIEREMSVSSLQWAGEFTGAGLMTFDDAVADTRAAIFEAALIGADCLIIHPGSRNGHTVSHALRLIRDALNQLIPIARDIGVTLAIEPTHPVCGRDFSFVDKIEVAQELVAEFGSRNLGIVYDTFFMGDSPKCLEQLSQCANEICLVQLADGDYSHSQTPERNVPGRGNLPLREMLELLAESGYEGYYELEVFGATVEYAGYDQLIQASSQSVEHIASRIKESQRQS